MIKNILLLSSFLISIAVNANCKKELKIAVIDTGFGYGRHGLSESKLCKTGHKDFTSERKYIKSDSGIEVPLDMMGHGTNIVGIIENYARKTNSDYCIVVLKFWQNQAQSKAQEISLLLSTIEAIKYATEIRADIINYSGGGAFPNYAEEEAVKKFLDNGGIFVAAAGNGGRNIDSAEGFYPATYDPRIVVVGSLDEPGKWTPSSFSNYGKKVDRLELGRKVEGYGIKLTGTSQSTAIATGKIASEFGCR